MLFVKPLYAKNVRSIWRIIQHAVQLSKVHKRDKAFYDALRERGAFEAVKGFFGLFGAQNLRQFRKLLRLAMEHQRRQREKRKKPKPNRSKKTKQKNNRKQEPRVGYHFIWSPPDSWQALFWALDGSRRSYLVETLRNVLSEIMEQRFRDAPRLITIHTDTPRIHAEVLICKYRDDKPLPGFKGIGSWDSDATHRAMLCALQGKPHPNEALEWAALMTRKMTLILRDRTKFLIKGIKESKMPGIVGKATKVYQWLRTIQTDETVAGRSQTRKRLGLELTKHWDLPVHARAHLEFAQWLGYDLPFGVEPKISWMSDIQVRIKKIEERREKDSEIEQNIEPQASGGITLSTNRKARERRRKKGKKRREDAIDHPIGEHCVESESESMASPSSAPLGGVQADQGIPNVSAGGERLHYDINRRISCESPSEFTILFEDYAEFKGWVLKQPDSLYAIQPGEEANAWLVRAVQQFNSRPMREPKKPERQTDLEI